MLIPNRELSQFAQYLSVEDSGNRNIGIATTGAPFVGIGTTNPTSKFFVNGNTTIVGIVTANSFKGSSQIGITSGGTYVGLTTNINFVGNGVTITSQYNSTLGITTFTFVTSSGASPGGAESQVQYYSGGIFTGSPNFTFNGSGVNIAGITTASRFISTVANGTSPLSVASSTVVTNLNADFLEGYNPASTNSANTIVLRDVNGNFSANQVTAAGFIGSIFDANTSRITTIYGTNSYYNNGFVDVGIVTTLTNTNANLNRVNISGIVTVGSNPVLIGLTTTGTQNQKLQVEGKGYFSDNVGIGSTNPSSRLSVVGDGFFSGVVTANTFSGVGLTISNNGFFVGIVTANTFSGVSATFSGGLYAGSTSISLLGVGYTNSLPGDRITIGNQDNPAFDEAILGFNNSNSAANNKRWATGIKGNEYVIQAIDDSYPGSGGGNILAIGRSNNELSYIRARSSVTGQTFFNFDFFNAAVGIGTTLPVQKFGVYQNVADYAMNITNEGNNSNRSGLLVRCGAYNAAGTNVAIAFSDGDGTAQGQISFTSGTVTYGAFTAHHDVILPEEATELGYPYGTLVGITSITYRQNSSGGTFERGILYHVQKTSEPYQRNVLGAYSTKYSNEENMHQVYILGDGHILCCGENGNITIGDGITSSSIEGIGMKMDVPGLIIGIAQENVSFVGSEVNLVPVQYGLRYYAPF